MHRMEHELQLLRGFLIRSEGSRVNGGGGAATQLWNAQSIVSGPAGSRHRAKERARRKKVAVLGDAEAEHLLLAARTLRERDRRRQEQMERRAVEEEEEIRRAVAAAALPPLPVKPRGPRHARQRKSSEMEPEDASAQPSHSRTNTSASALMAALPREGQRARSARTPEPPTHTSAQVKLGNTTPRTPRSAHLLGNFASPGDVGGFASPHIRQNLSSARDGGEGGNDDEGGPSGSNFTPSGIHGLLHAAQLFTPGGSKIPNPRHRVRADHDEYYPKGVSSGFGGLSLADQLSPSKRRRVNSVSAARTSMNGMADEDEEDVRAASPVQERRQRTLTAPEAGKEDAQPASQLSALDLLADQAAASQHPSSHSDWSNSGAEEDAERKREQRAISAAMQIDEPERSEFGLNSSPLLQQRAGSISAFSTPGDGSRRKLKPGMELPKEKRVPYIRWTDPEDRKLRAAIKEYGQRWVVIRSECVILDSADF